MVYTGFCETCFTKIVLKFQTNSSLITTSHQQKLELYKLFALCRLTTVLPNVAIEETTDVKISQ